MNVAPTRLQLVGLSLLWAIGAALGQSPADSTGLRDREGDFLTDPVRNRIDLRDPAAVEQTVEYDPDTDRYIVTERIGGSYFRSPTYLTFEEYQAYRERQRQTRYFDQLQGKYQPGVGLSALEDPIDGVDVENSLIDRLFGGTDLSIQTRGNVDLTIGADYRTTANPNIITRAQRQGGFLFNMNIQMNVTGSIGEKLTLNSTYNTQSNFSFDRQLIKVQYDAAEFSEDEIIQDIQLGNVSLPLRSNLIQGSQGLLGVRADMKFGDLKVTAIASQQKTKRGQVEIKGGAQYQEFSVRADEYDENRHFFLSHFNRGQFEGALTNLPNITSLFKINRIEVWLTNDRDQTEGVRDLIALADLGEGERVTNANVSVNPGAARGIGGELLPDNGVNDLYADLLDNPANRLRQNAVGRLQAPPFSQEQSTGFERVRARLLSAQEYSYHPDLGFISVNVNVRPDQVLAVAYEYTYNGRVYKVGEFSNDVPAGDSTNFNVLYTRMLKSTTPRVDVPAWDLMMKNFYNIGAYQVNREDFRLDITYEDPGGGQKRFLPTSNVANIPLIRLFQLDQLNVQLDPQPDGIFDFVPDLTIYARNGHIMFPVLEPFGSTLADLIDTPSQRERYVYDILYDSTVVRAREYPEFNRFIIRGSYKSSVSNEISLGAFNIPRGSVRVTAGGQILKEGIDYEIDYNIGRIRILNDAYLNSGVPVRATFEDNAVFGQQNRSMVGLRADYEVNDDLSVGGTFMHMREQPFTQKVNIGDDPINNRIFGVDMLYGGDAPWLTRLVDKLPGISTRAPSSVNFSAEAAFLQPGHSKAIDVQEGEGGTVYVDDFEGSASGFDLKTPLSRWRLASVPQGNPLFPESNRVLQTRRDSLALNANRALLNWYRLDRGGGGSDGGAGDPYAYQASPQEIYPLRQQSPYAANNFLFTFDLTYRPQERGPYNFDVPGGYGGLTSGLSATGQLNEPGTRWGGIMRDLTTNDFQAANIEYLEFWVMSPFLDGRTAEVNEGDLYIEFGNISEDVMRDSRLFFENGLPAGGEGDANQNRPVDTTTFGRIPRLAPVVQAFDNEPENRAQQDLGYDGVDDAGEAVLYGDWLTEIQDPTTGGDPITAAALAEIAADPSNDNFASFVDQGGGVVDSYRAFNGPQGNSPVAQGTGLATNSTNLPDSEDVNGDNTLSETESYFRYRIPFRAEGTEGFIDQEAARYVTQVRVVEETDGSRARPRTVWYRFKVPLDQFDARVGSIQDFRSVRFMRMYLRGFERQTTFRFARLDLVRNQWRRYLRNDALRPPGPVLTEPDVPVLFDVDAINVEENTGREPFSYVLPQGIVREQQLNTPGNLQVNEQSQVMTVCGLPDGQARAIYKIVNLDMRVYERLRMFTHAEEFDENGSSIAPEDLEDGDVRLFVRLGSDFQDNYYEYELPLKFTREDEVTTDPPASEVIWPQENDLDIVLADLIDLKQRRNDEGVDLRTLFSMRDPRDSANRMAVIGNPNLGLVKGVLIGLRNPRGGADRTCAQVWINELRLNGLDERGGQAGQARLDLQLADFGTISSSASFSSIGWGAIDQKLAERARESTLNYDVSGTFELGKFLPAAAAVQLPVTLVYANNVKTPEFDPYDLDITLKDKLRSADDRDSIREQAVDRVVQREINVTNVRKERTSDGPPMPWDISNFTASYVRNETDRTSPLIELDETLNHYGSLDYNYNLRTKPIRPFRKLIKNEEYFNLVREFNFNPLPNAFSFSTTMDRVLQSTRYRFSGPDPELNTFFNRNWTWDRDYSLNWDFSRNLRLAFNATNRAVIDELPTFDADGNPIAKDVRVDDNWDRLLAGGRNKAYQHRFDVNYTVPTEQLPYLEFLKVTAQYSGSYNWNAGALNLQDSLGNVITNGQQRQLRADVNFEQLYRKFNYLEKIQSRRREGGRRGRRDGDLDESPPTLPTPDDEDAGAADDPDAAREAARQRRRERQPSTGERVAIRPLLLLRRGNVTYNEEFSTTLPGFLPQAQVLGMSGGFGDPGYEFVAGFQPDIRGSFGQPQSEDYLYQRREQFASAITLNQQVFQTYTRTIAAQLSLEPFRDFKLDLDLSSRFSENHSEFFKDTVAGPEESFARLVPTDVGSYAISYGALTTFFGQSSDDLFAAFEDERLAISERLNANGLPHLDSAYASRGFFDGYGPEQQDVLMGAFLRTYADLEDDGDRLNVFDVLPKPNWRLTYNGLARLAPFKKAFSRFSLTHSYKSTLTVNSFNTNLLYEGPQTINPSTQSYFSRLVIPNVVIQEAFSPLIGIDATLQNEMSVRFSFNKARNLGMSFVDNTLAERNNQEFSFGYGYVVKNVDLLRYIGISQKAADKAIIRTSKDKDADDVQPDGEEGEEADGKRRRGRRGKRRRGPSNAVGKDLDLQLDVRYADDDTRNRTLDQAGASQATRGATTFTLSPSAEYEINTQLSVRLFVDYRSQTPKVSNSFRTTNTQAGLTIRFKLQ